MNSNLSKLGNLCQEVFTHSLVALVKQNTTEKPLPINIMLRIKWEVSFFCTQQLLRRLNCNYGIRCSIWKLQAISSWLAPDALPGFVYHHYWVTNPLFYPLVGSKMVLDAQDYNWIGTSRELETFGPEFRGHIWPNIRMQDLDRPKFSTGASRAVLLATGLAGASPRPRRLHSHPPSSSPPRRKIIPQ